MGKAQLRARIRARRRAMSEEERSLFARQVSEVLEARWQSAQRERKSTTAVAAFWPMPGEPSPVPWLTSLRERGVPVWLPVCLPEFALGWTLWEDSTVFAPAASQGVGTKSSLALYQPALAQAGLEAVRDIALMVVPALAVSESGARLGQGGGYYDRLLASLYAPGLEASGLDASDVATPQLRNTHPVTDPPAAKDATARPRTAALVFAHEIFPEHVLSVDEHDMPVDEVVTVR